MTAEALKQFMLQQGPSRNTVNMEWDKIWAVNRGILDPAVPRYTCIRKAGAVRLTIENGPSPPEARSHPLHPRDKTLGHKPVIFGKELLIEFDDAKSISVGEKVTLIKWGNCTITRKDEIDGALQLYATIDVDDYNFKDTKKLTWICDDPATTCEIKMCEFDHLITKEKVEENDDIEQIFNRNSRFEDVGIAEGIIRSLPQGSYF